MNHRNDDGRDFQSGREYGQDAGNIRGQSRPGRVQHGYGAPPADRGRQQPSFAQAARNRGEYYGDRQFDERMQGTQWNEERGNWDYEGGPERYATSVQAEHEFAQPGRAYGNQANTGDYYRGRQGYGAQGSFGGDYDTYGRSQGYGDGSGYTRQQSARNQFSGTMGDAGATRRGGESAGLGAYASYGNQNYLDEGEMSGYVGRPLGSQQYASMSRHGAASGQFAHGAGSYRGVGPKNYRRSDERLAEDINERLTDDDDLDASNLTVRVADGKVTLEGAVDQRWMKHRAEDIADACMGVKEVDNRIMVSSSGSAIDPGVDTRSGTSRTTPGTTTGSGTSH